MIQFRNLVIVSLAVTLACSTGEPDDIEEIDAPGESSPEGEVEPDPPRRPKPLQEPGLVPAEWPADLDSVDVHPGESGAVLVGRNAEGRPIARIELADEGPEVIAVRAWWHDGHAWAVVDAEYGVVVAANFEGVDEPAVLERLETMAAVTLDQALLDPMGPQSGPRLDCAIAVIRAVFQCLPWGGMIECPDGIIEAVCTCGDAAAKLKPGKKRKRPRPAMCGG